MKIIRRIKKMKNKKKTNRIKKKMIVIFNRMMN